MATKIRPVVSEKRQYYISRHRYYELKHFCLQYNEWRNVIFSQGRNLSKSLVYRTSRNKEFDDPVGDEVCRVEEAKHNIELVEESAACTDEFLKDYILESVTQERSYTYLKLMENMPCSRDKFYICYHKFFWVLSHKKHAV